MQQFKRSTAIVAGWFLTLFASLALLPGSAVFGTGGIASSTSVHLPLVIRQPSQGGWLDYVNYYRAMAGLPPVTEHARWSYGNTLHARYMVKNDIVEHAEDPGNK